MNNFEINYKNLILDILSNGISRPSRGNINTYSSFGKSIQHNLIEGFPILTGKKIFPKNFIHELIWILNGESNIGYLKNNNVNIWNNWADENGDIGPSYGYQLRKFNGEVDQLKSIINNIKKDKYSRRHLISLWNPLQLNEQILPPCYFSFQFYVDHLDNININVFMRSCDIFIGLPYDFSLFAVLLIVIAKETNLIPKLVQFNFTDLHFYENQLNSIVKYLGNSVYELPKITYIGNLSTIKYNDFTLIGYKSNEFIKTEITI